MKLTKTIGYLCLVIFIFASTNKYSLDYLLHFLGNSDNYEFYEFSPLAYLITSYFLALIGRSFFAIRHTYIYKMFPSDNERYMGRTQSSNGVIKIITVT